MSHQGGHGDVTLPADYVREHVRLGYAATEHGWQSDTVDTAIALTSPATTRRGLYVAATRGRDDNILCVVTDSDDVAEARDVLEAILAADRADVPATTQRRTLAQRRQQPHARRRRRTIGLVAGSRLVRSELYTDARQDLAAAQRAVDENTSERARRQAALANAQSELAVIDRTTAAHRERLAMDTRPRRACPPGPRGGAASPRGQRSLRQA